MAALIRPTLLLRMDLDEGQYSDERVAEIRRSYSFIAPSSVLSHAKGPDGPENVIRFLIKLQRPYWDSSEEGADELWETVVLKWLKNMFYKVSNTLTAFNSSARARGASGLDFAWLELEFTDSLLALRLQTDSSIPQAALSLVQTARELTNTGPLRDVPAACIRIPSRTSYAAQLANARRTAAKAEVDDADADDAAAGAAATDDQAPSAGQTGFEVDYTVWGIEGDDGTVREFDSATTVFAD
jgi:hypothetical protein